MIKVFIPKNYVFEREYSVKVTLGHFLGLDYKLYREDVQNTRICFNEKTIEIEDTFWSRGDNLDYLSTDRLPVAQFATSEYAVEKDIPVLYGNGKIEVKLNSAYCGIDIFASVFFLLTRWEEYVVNKRDEHGRFIGKESILYKTGILCRPVVNEYIELLWNILKGLGYDGLRKERDFHLYLTHDIDYPYMRYRPLRITKRMLSFILKGNMKEALSYIQYFFHDPYDEYDFFMNISEKVGTRSCFYFMSSSPDVNTDRRSLYFSKRYKKIVESINSRGHVIGFHPGYSTSMNLNNWDREKGWLEDVIGFRVFEGRQHYLRFSVPETFSFWEKNNMLIDSSLSYHDVEGFRCGTGDDFPVYNFLERKEYVLKERPLIVMDATLDSYQGYSISQIKDILIYYLEIGMKYKSSMTFLFHNSSFLGIRGRELKRCYEDTLKDFLNYRNNG